MHGVIKTVSFVQYFARFAVCFEKIECIHALDIQYFTILCNSVFHEKSNFFNSDKLKTCNYSMLCFDTENAYIKATNQKKEFYYAPSN